MPDQIMKPSIEELIESLELNFKFFIENTLCAIPNKTDLQHAKIFRESMSPISLMYMFVFIEAACKKYGYTNLPDVGTGMAIILRNIFRVSQQQSFELFESSLDLATIGLNEYINENRTLPSIVYKYAYDAGASFVPGEADINSLNAYTLIVYSSSILD